MLWLRESAAEADSDFHSGVHVGHVLRERCQCMILNQDLSHLLFVFSKQLFVFAVSGEVYLKSFLQHCFNKQELILIRIGLKGTL